MLSPAQFWFDDLRECRDAWREYEEWNRLAEQERRAHWPGYMGDEQERGVVEIEMDDDAWPNELDY